MIRAAGSRADHGGPDDQGRCGSLGAGDGHGARGRVYGDTLGLPVTEHDDDWSEVDANGLRIGLNGSATESPDGDGGALIAFQPDGELDDEVQRLEGAGVRFSDGVSEHPWGRIVPFKDPDGNDLQLYAPPR